MTPRHHFSRRASKGVAGVALIVCGLVAADPSVASGQELSTKVRAGWRIAGAVFGTGDGKDATVPGFAFTARPRGGFALLPVPEVPFILSLHGPSLTADDFKALARMTTLWDLSLIGGLVTPPEKVELRGLGALAELPNLRSLGLERITRSMH